MNWSRKLHEVLNKSILACNGLKIVVQLLYLVSAL